MRGQKEKKKKIVTKVKWKTFVSSVFSIFLLEFPETKTIAEGETKKTH